MRMLITGSGGLIGGHLARALLAEGHTVLAAYRTTPPRMEGGSTRLRLIPLDLSKMSGGLPPVDVVVHAAAHTLRVPNSSARDYVQSNLMGTLNLIDYARATRPRLFVYLSAMSVYGDVAVDEVDEETPLSRPEIYGASKYVAELIVREAGGSFPVICVRLPGVVGRGEFTPWVGTMLRSAIRHEPLRIYSPDALFNNIVDLREIVRFLSHLIARGAAGCDLVNLAASEPMRIRDVIARLRLLTGSRSEVLVTDRAGKRSFAISTARLRDRLGFHPAATREILDRYVTQHVSSGAMERCGEAPSTESPSSQEAAVSVPGAGR